MTIAQQVQKLVAEALTKLGINSKAETTESAAASAPAAGVITAEIQQAIQAAVESAIEPLKGQLTKAQSDLTAANTTIGERDAAIAQLTKEKGELEARLKDPKGEAGKQSAQILAGLHVQPVKAGAEAGAGAKEETSEALLEKYQAITDYRERGQFYLKHKDKLLQASAGKLTIAK
jgi:hypothetical protein